MAKLACDCLLSRHPLVVVRQMSRLQLETCPVPSDKLQKSCTINSDITNCFEILNLPGRIEGRAIDAIRKIKCGQENDYPTSI